MNEPTALVKFQCLAPDTYPPMRADRGAAGTLPTRGFRHCEPVTSASAYGWYLFPPTDFILVFDGAEVLCRFPEHGDEWHPVLSGVLLPGTARYFSENAPPELQAYVPKFIISLPVPGVVQIWTGYFASTAQDWSLLLRAPVNIPRSLNYEHFEGLVEFDQWPGSVFANVRLLKTDHPIEFQKSMPLVQAQPVHRSTYADALLRRFLVTGPDWHAFRRVVVEPNEDLNRRRGAYAVQARKRPDADSPFPVTA